MSDTEPQEKIEDEPEKSRRKYVRKTTNISAVITNTSTNYTGICTILDVNPEGCRIAAKYISNFNGNVRISPLGIGSPISGEIIWSRAGEAGICFWWNKSKQENFWIKNIRHVQASTSQQDPRYYELWHYYINNSNSDLNKAIDAEAREDGQFPDKVLDEIYDKYLSPTRLAIQVDEVSSQCMNEFVDIEDALDEASEFTSEFERSLTKASNQLDGLEDAKQVRVVVGELVKTTQEMELKSRGLESQLASSREQINALNQTLETVREDLMTDTLTGISNRSCFDKFLDISIQEAQNSQKPLALLFGDIDHFKRFNDSYGHQLGDSVLKQVAQILDGNVKGCDLAARYGGEEFAIILPRTDARAATILANQLCELIAARKPIKTSTNEVIGSITMSFGVAVYRSGENKQSFIERSDAALYSAKRSGRNQVKSEGEIVSKNLKVG